MLRTSMFLSLTAAADVREITRNRETRDKTDVSSSVRPFAQKSLAASEVKLMNGRTAIDTAGADRSASSRRSMRAKPEIGYVRPFGNRDHNGVGGSLTVVILVEPSAQLHCFYSHDRVRTWIERWSSVEDLDSEYVFL